MASAELARCIGAGSRNQATWLRDRGRPRVVPGTDPTGWSDLFGLDLLDDLLHGTALRRPYFHVTKDGRRSPLTRITRETRVLGAAITGVPHPEHIYAELAGGASLVLLHLEDLLPAVRRFCVGISAELERVVDCGAYVSPPAVAGLPLHKDSQDVILLQVTGDKTWSVHEEIDDGRPLGRKIRPEERPERVLQAKLRTGDALIIPSGHPHAAVSGSSVSCHLTIGITPPARRDALSERLASLAASVEGLDAVLDDRREIANEQVRSDLRRLATALEADAAAAGDLRPRVCSPLPAASRLGDLNRLLTGVPGNWLADMQGPVPPGLPRLASAVVEGQPFSVADAAADGLPQEWVRTLVGLVLSGRARPE